MITVRKAGEVYRGDTCIRGRRMRLSLGTRNEDAAQRLASRIEKALAEGGNSVIWAELKPVLPQYTFQQLAESVGYQPPGIQVEPLKATWGDLRRSFEGYMDKRIAIGKLRESTKTRYRRPLEEFDAFLSENKIVFLQDINKPLLESFKVWRLERIKGLKQSRGGTGLVLDVAILHKVFQVGVDEEMITRNPVIFEGRPGESPTRGAQPFSAKQLTELQKYAKQDFLMFILLRWTGMRGSDVVNLRWSEIHFDRKEIERVTQKRTKKVIIPIQADLLAVLEMERDRRNPQLHERVLLHPKTQTPMSRPRLYKRMKSLGNRAGVPDAHPHRFRDTFAVDMLARGASPYEVAKLLGDTIETVEKHYAEFVRELRERVRRMMDSGKGLEEFSVPDGEVTKAHLIV
jgi:integrase